MEINTYNLFNSAEFIIDMHIHTRDSSSKEEFMCAEITPLELLEEFRENLELKNSSKTEKSCAIFSTTDHDIIKGCKEIASKIKSDPEKYRYIKYIPGCEFTVSCGSLGTFVKNGNGDKESIIHPFHLLAYNFDVNDKVLNYYSNLKDNTEYGNYFECNGRAFSYGTIVLVGKKFLSKLGYNFGIPNFVDFEIQKGYDPTDKKVYVKNVENFCEYCKDNLGVNKERDINNLKKYLLGVSYKKHETDFDLEEVNYGNVSESINLDVMEVMSMVENAGGVCVLAHPNLIKLNEHYYRKFTYQKDPHNFIAPKYIPDYSVQGFQKFSKANLEAKRKLITFVVENLIYNAFDPITKNRLKGLVGLELLHASNIKKDSFTILTDLAEKHGLYTTGGSDKHGKHFKKIVSIGQVMPLEIEAEFHNLAKKKITFSIYSSSFTDDILAGEKLERKKGNNYIEMVLKLERKYAILDYHTVKKFVNSYAKPDYFERIKRNNYFNEKHKKVEDYKFPINFELIQ